MEDVIRLRTMFTPWWSYIFAVPFGAAAYFSSTSSSSDAVICFAFPLISVGYLLTLRRFFLEPVRLHVYGHTVVFVIAVLAGVCLHGTWDPTRVVLATVYSIVAFLTAVLGAVLLIIARDIRRRVESMAREIETAVNAFTKPLPDEEDR